MIPAQLGYRVEFMVLLITLKVSVFVFLPDTNNQTCPLGDTTIFFSILQCSPLSLVEECRDLALIGREQKFVAMPDLICHKEPGGFHARKGRHQGVELWYITS